MSRLLAVDPGEVRIGLAVSDPTGILARPLTVIPHRSREKDVAAILRIAGERAVSGIVVGIPLGLEGEPGPQARKALRLLEALRERSDLPVIPWDESGSTQTALNIRGRDDRLDARAAAVILQDYLDAQSR